MSMGNEKAKVIDLPFRGRPVLPPWTEQKLHAITRESYSELKRFLVKRHTAEKSVVVLKDVDRFISQEQQMELDWKSLLRLCRKKHADEPELWNPDYWMSPTPKRELSYVVLGGNTLIYKGVYKTAAARMALHRRDADSLYGVRVARWGIDWETYRLWKRLDELCNTRFPHLSVKPKRKKIHVEERGNWKIEQYFLALKRINEENGKEDTLNLQEAQDWLSRMENAKSPGLIQLFHRKSGAAVA